MKLTDLEPRFLRTNRTEEGTFFHDVEKLEDAQGIMFLCPHCFREHGKDGPERHGVHSVLIWFADRNVDPIYTPTPRWRVEGTGLDDLTTTPSILIHGCWHGFITRGEVTFC